MNQHQELTHSRIAMLTWIPRVFSGLILLTVGGFMLAYFVGGEESSSRTLVLADYLGLTALVASLVGLAVAWKRERLGAAITLVSVGVGIACNWHVITFPLVLIPIAAILFLLCALLKANASIPRKA